MNHNILLAKDGDSPVCFPSEEHISILECAEKYGVPLRNGCRIGACRVCKLKLIQGNVKTSECVSSLTRKERGEGYFLPCISYAQSDIICSRDEKLITEKIGVVVIDVYQNEYVSIIKFCLPKKRHYLYNYFSPGCHVLINIDEKTCRVYSVANLPHIDKFIEIHVSKKSGGLFSDKICSSIKKWDVLWITGPSSGFSIKEKQEKFTFISTGTGFAPIKSLITFLLLSNSHKEIKFFWGGKNRNHVYFGSDLEEWQKSGTKFSFYIIFSEEDNDGKKYVQDLISEIMPQDAFYGNDIYICGSSSMVFDVTSILKSDFNVDINNINTDSF